MILILLLMGTFIALVVSLSALIMAAQISRDEEIKRFQKDASKGGHRVN